MATATTTAMALPAIKPVFPWPDDSSVTGLRDARVVGAKNEILFSLNELYYSINLSFIYIYTISLRMKVLTIVTVKAKYTPMNKPGTLFNTLIVVL